MPPPEETDSSEDKEEELQKKKIKDNWIKRIISFFKKSPEAVPVRKVSTE